MRRLLLIALIFAASSGRAATLLAVPAGARSVVRADPGTIALLDAATLRPLWSAGGVRNPASLVLSPDGKFAAVLDSLANQVAIADLQRRATRVVAVPETPVAAAFDEDALFVLSRDAGVLSKIGPADGTIRSAEVPDASSLLLISPDGVLVYAPLTGATARIDPATLAILGSHRLPRHGSDLEQEGGSGYLLLPRAGRLIVFSLASLVIIDERAAGAVPVDGAVEAPANATRDARIAIADPSSKRVWRDEGAQSTAAAVGRGVLRGLLGLGLYNPTSTALPSGIDRIVVSGDRLLAFDTSTGSVYAVRGKTPTEVAARTTWGSFAVAGRDLFIARGSSIDRIPLP